MAAAHYPPYVDHYRYETYTELPRMGRLAGNCPLTA